MIGCYIDTSTSWLPRYNMLFCYSNMFISLKQDSHVLMMTPVTWWNNKPCRYDKMMSGVIEIASVVLMKLSDVISAYNDIATEFNESISESDNSIISLNELFCFNSGIMSLYHLIMSLKRQRELLERYILFQKVII